MLAFLYSVYQAIMINKLLNKLVQSILENTGLILFLQVYGHCLQVCV